MRDDDGDACGDGTPGRGHGTDGRSRRSPREPPASDTLSACRSDPVNARHGSRRIPAQMASIPDAARVVIIGAGIVGNSMAWHLARLGWRDIVLLEKGVLPNPGGSTGHASNFIFLTDHSKEMAAFTIESARQYHELGVYSTTGGIEVARTPERMDELQRRMASSRSWGVDGGRVLTPAEVKAMVPFIDETVILGGFYTPGVGVVDSLQAGTLMREKAQALGAL